MSSRVALRRLLACYVARPHGDPVLLESCVQAGARSKHSTLWQMRRISENTIFCPRVCRISKIVSSPQNRLRYSTSVEEKEDRICWKCRKPIASSVKFVCDYCKAIIPPSKHMTYFEMLNIPNNFDVHISTLQKNFKDLQRTFHPDKFSLSDDAEKEISATSSSLLNKAYSTLLTPLARGIYMLELEGIFLGEETQLDDPEFLAEVMELNEQISDAEDDDNLREIWHDVSETSKDLVTEISDAFRDGNGDSAKSLLIKLRYYENILQKLKELLPPS